MLWWFCFAMVAFCLFLLAVIGNQKKELDKAQVKIRELYDLSKSRIAVGEELTNAEMKTWWRCIYCQELIEDESPDYHAKRCPSNPLVSQRDELIEAMLCTGFERTRCCVCGKHIFWRPGFNKVCVGCENARRQASE